ncbi:MAG: hypothetical protein K9L30_09430 [Desulfobacterales bacterium]|nr:hypothetical protein [Desulfobacterales bacterium]
MLKKIKLLLQEAELYRSQSLLTEARRKYLSASDLLTGADDLKNRDLLLNGVNNKVKALELEIDKINGATSSPEVDAKVQDLIKQLFSIPESGNDERAPLEGAIALAKFGQFERAVKEFKQLLANESLRFEAAKNIIRCMSEVSDSEGIVANFEDWDAASFFKVDQFEKLKKFTREILEKKGMKHAFFDEPEPDILPESVFPEVEEEEDVIDINAISIAFVEGPLAGQNVELDVSFQNGNIITMLIPSKEKLTIESLSVGTVMDNVQYFSPIALFSGKGLIAQLAEIAAGPKKGDFSLDIKVISG